MYRAPCAPEFPSRTLAVTLFLAAGLVVALLPATAPAAEPPSGATPGITFAGSPGVTETTSEIMARAAKEPPTEIQRVTEPKKIRPDRTKLPQDPDALPVAQWPPLPEGGNDPQAFTPFSPQTLGTTFLGATLAGVNPTSAFPPDSMGAVGPTQYIVAVNGRIVSFSKTTGLADGVLNATTNTFFNSVRNGAGTSDPRIRYDRLTQRWIVVIINVSFPNRILVAVSNAASAGVVSGSTVWTYFFLAIDTAPPAISNTCLMDYPTLGVDANALYIGGNNFCGAAPQTFHSTDGWVIRKSSVLGAGPIVATVFRALGTGAVSGPYTPQGVDNYDPAATEGYFIGTDTRFYGRLNLRRVSTPAGTPAISANVSVTNVSTTSGPLNVPHLGNTGGANGQLDALDERLYAAHFRSGKLLTAHNIGVNAVGVASGTLSRTATRWYEITGVAAGNTPTVSQSGTVYDPLGTNPVFYWIPSIMVSGQGHAALGFSTAGANARVNAGTVGRLVGDTPGTTGTPVNYTASSTAYNPGSDTGVDRGARRWGDYSYTSLDPNDDMTMWTIQEFCNATNSYGVQVVKLLAPPPATPATCTPTSVVQGASNVSVVVTGTSTSGSGFFDPAGTCSTCSSHIAATVSGTGVTVNSVSYTDPTHVTLNLTVAAGAAAGGRNVTGTNPDGQAVTGTGILTVRAPCATITGTVTGGGTVCAGSPSSVTVTVSGGTPPYAVTLNNGGGTQNGAGPAFTFPVSPAASTTYSVATLTDSLACTGSGSGSATVTVRTAPTTATVGGAQTICASSTTAALGGNTPSSGTGQWSVVSGGSGTFSPSATTPGATFSHTSGTGPVVLRWTISNAPCTASTADVTVTVKQPPTTATVGTAQTICANGTTTALGGNTPSVGAGQWSVVSGGAGTFSPNATTGGATFTHTSGTGPVVLRWTISNAPCTASTADVTVTVNQPPTTATVGGPQTICASGTTTSLGGNPPIVGAGQWSIVSGGAGTFSPNSATPTATFTHTGGTGPVVLRWTITRAPCTASTADVTITVNPAPTTATVGGAQTICASGTTTGLGGNTPSSGTGQWSVVSGGTGTFSPNATTPGATFTHTGGTGPVVLRWTISRAPCTASTADVTVTVNPAPTAATVGGPQAICTNGRTANLGGNTPTVGTGRWTVVSGGTGVFSPNATTPDAAFTHTGGVGPVVLRWTISNATCTASTADVTVTVNPAPTTATVGGSQIICASGTTIGLGGNAPTSGTGQWSVVSGGTGVFSPNATTPGPTFTHTGGAGPLVLRWTISREPCPASTADVTVTVNPAPTSATTGGPQTVATNGTTTSLGGNTPSVGTGQWSIVSGGTGVFAPNGATPGATFTHTGGAGPVVLRWTITSASCPASTADVLVTIHAADASTRLFNLTPCRLVDTRDPAGPLGGPAIGAGQTRVFPLVGVCGIPTGAVALVLNVTGVTPAAAGSFALFPGNGTFADTASVAFMTGKTRAAAGISKLATDGSGTLSVRNSAPAAVDLILDVSGYFAPVAAGGKVEPSGNPGGARGEVK